MSDHQHQFPLIEYSESPHPIRLFARDAALALSLVVYADFLLAHAAPAQMGLLLVPAVFYSLKVILTLIGRRHPSVAILGFVVAAGIAVLMQVRRDSFEMGSYSSSLVVLVAFTYITIPACTFFSDLRVQGRTTRLLVWRSVFELVILLPVWIVCCGIIGVVFEIIPI